MYKRQGLRYHGMSSTLSELYHQGLMEATSVKQTEVFEAAEYFARVEGILPAPESSHAIRVAIDLSLIHIFTHPKGYSTGSFYFHQRLVFPQ